MSKERRVQGIVQEFFIPERWRLGGSEDSKHELREVLVTPLPLSLTRC
jgi:hypothetical protein